MIAFMKLPIGFRTYSIISKDKLDVEVESVAAKQRWSQREVQEHPDENNVKRRSRREVENNERAPQRDNNVVDFSRLRVTQFKCNKGIFMPSPLDERSEIKVGVTGYYG